jgi:hypothetical protein
MEHPPPPNDPDMLWAAGVLNNPCNISKLCYHSLMLTDLHRKALELQLSGMTIPQIAKRLDRRRETVWKWTKEPEYAEELRRLRKDAMDAVQVELRAASVEAARVLREIMNDSEINANARIRAAVSILDRTAPLKQSVEIDEPGKKELNEWQALSVVS